MGALYSTPRVMLPGMDPAVYRLRDTRDRIAAGVFRPRRKIIYLAANAENLRGI